MFDKILSLAGEIFEPVRKLVDDVHTSDEERLQMKKKIMELEGKMYKEALDVEKARLKAQASIIKAEATGAWYQRLWRPLLMYIIMLILVNNIIVVPFVNYFSGGEFVILDMPKELWYVMITAVGGYIGGRSYEKGKTLDVQQVMKDMKEVSD